jgi:hypothetical protein
MELHAFSRVNVIDLLSGATCHEVASQGSIVPFGPAEEGFQEHKRQMSHPQPGNFDWISKTGGSQVSNYF